MLNSQITSGWQFLGNSYLQLLLLKINIILLNPNVLKLNSYFCWILRIPLSYNNIIIFPNVCKIKFHMIYVCCLKGNKTFISFQTLRSTSKVTNDGFMRHLTPFCYWYVYFLGINLLMMSELENMKMINKKINGQGISPQISIAFRWFNYVFIMYLSNIM